MAGGYDMHHGVTFLLKIGLDGQYPALHHWRFEFFASINEGRTW